MQCFGYCMKPYARGNEKEVDAHDAEKRDSEELKQKQSNNTKHELPPWFLVR